MFFMYINDILVFKSMFDSTFQVFNIEKKNHFGKSLSGCMVFEKMNLRNKLV